MFIFSCRKGTFIWVFLNETLNYSNFGSCVLEQLCWYVNIFILEKRKKADFRLPFVSTDCFY